MAKKETREECDHEQTVLVMTTLLLPGLPLASAGQSDQRATCCLFDEESLHDGSSESPQYGLTESSAALQIDFQLVQHVVPRRSRRHGEASLL